MMLFISASIPLLGLIGLIYFLWFALLLWWERRLKEQDQQGEDDPQDRQDG